MWTMAAPTIVERPRTSDPSGRFGEATRVVVCNDDHNSFDGVAVTLARFVPGVDVTRGFALATQIHMTGAACVWSGFREVAELYWEQLNGAGLTMAPLE